MIFKSQSHKIPNQLIINFYFLIKSMSSLKKHWKTKTRLLPSFTRTFFITDLIYIIIKPVLGKGLIIIFQITSGHIAFIC